LNWRKVLVLTEMACEASKPKVPVEEKKAKKSGTDFGKTLVSQSDFFFKKKKKNMV